MSDFVAEMVADVLPDTVLDGGMQLKKLEAEPLAVDPADDRAFHANRPSVIGEKDREAELHPRLQRYETARAASAGRQIEDLSLGLEVVVAE